MAVSNRLRFEILRRDQFRCVYCGAAAKDGAVLEIDHVLPKVLGGNDKPNNLVSACETCNSGKGSSHPDSPPIEGVEEDALRWWKAMRRAGEMLAADLDARETAHRDFEDAWNRWGYGEGSERRLIPKPADWKRSVDELRAAGLPIWALTERIPTVMRDKDMQDSQRFRKVIGLGWVRVKALRETADVVLADGEEPSEPWGKAPNRYALAVMLLNRLREADRRRAFARADAVLEDGEQQTEEQRAISALWFAIDNLKLERLSLAAVLEDLLHALPDEIGTRAIEATEASIDPEFSDHRPTVLAHATANVLFSFSLRQARAYLNGLPVDEHEKWLAQAKISFEEYADRMSEDDYVVAAADLAAEAAEQAVSC